MQLNKCNIARNSSVEDVLYSEAINLNYIV